MADSSGEGPVKELVDGISGINVDGKAEPKSPVMEDVLKTPTTPATPGSPISVNGTPSSPGTPTKDGKTLLGQFKAFSKFGDPKSDGKSITLSQSDKWMKQAGLIDGKKITTTDTGIYFKKFKSLKIGFADWQKFLAELTKTKQFDLAEAKEKLISCGPPGTRVKVSHSTGVYDRLTNTNNFTGTHKERFDGSGRGKGLEGRREKSDSGGYVQGYKNRSQTAHK